MIHRKRPRFAATIPTSTMADIAFLMIVFFLVTTSFNQEKGLGLTLPSYGATTRVPSRNITNVWINAQGQIMHDLTEVNIEILGERIRVMTAENENLIVSIKTDPKARYEYFVAIVDEIKKAGNSKISLAEPDF